MHIKSLKIEYLESPLGLDEQKPRFYWQCEFKQFEYQIIVTIKNGQTAWNSGRVKSSQSAHIELHKARTDAAEIGHHVGSTASAVHCRSGELDTESRLLFFSSSVSSTSGSDSYRSSSGNTELLLHRFHEVGEILGLTPGTAKVRAHRALKNLRSLVQREGTTS